MKFNIQRSKTFKAVLGLLLGSSIMLGGSANASEKTLRVCAAADELPYSNKNLEGFENKLAEILAETMGRQLEYVWSDKAAIFLVTEKLLKNECDVVMGVDKDDPRVATSIPYYKSGYAFIYPAGKGLDIKTWKSPDLKAMTKFAVVPGSPSEVMLRELDKYEGNFNYLMSLIGFKSRRNQYVRYKPDLLVSEVASGKADIAHIWAPEAARYVKASPVPLEMVVSEEMAETHGGEGVLQHYEQCVAVRSEDTDLLAEINSALKKADSKIKAVLEQEGVPLL